MRPLPILKYYPSIRLKELKKFLVTSVRIANLRAQNRTQDLLNMKQEYSVNLNLPSLKMPVNMNLYICKPTVVLYEGNEIEMIGYAE
jgi:hypothetical protein